MSNGNETVERIGIEADRAFVELYRTEHDGQVRRAYLLVGDVATAHDVVADAFLAVYRRWDRIEDPGPYLNRCVLNGCRDVGRRARRLHPVAEPVGPAASGDAADATTDPLDELGHALARLPFRQRAAVVLRFHGRCSEAEIAHHLGCRPGTVGSLIHRALAALRRQLLEESP